MVLTDVLILLCMCFLIPKKGKKKPKRRKRIAGKSRFKIYDNPLKSYRLEPTKNIKQKAQECRAQQLAACWAAEMATKCILDKVGVGYEHQAIIFRTGSYICVDFLLRDRCCAIELDGSAHANQKKYDLGRDQWLEKAHGIRTLRLTNHTVLRTPVHAEAAIRRFIGKPR